jgi:hypothetical protein
MFKFVEIVARTLVRRQNRPLYTTKSQYQFFNKIFNFDVFDRIFLIFQNFAENSVSLPENGRLYLFDSMFATFLLQYVKFICHFHGSQRYFLSFCDYN